MWLFLCDYFSDHLQSINKYHERDSLIIALTGYQIAFAPLKNGRPSGMLSLFLQALSQMKKIIKFVADLQELHFAQDGALLVADDAGNTIWRVAHKSNS